MKIRILRFVLILLPAVFVWPVSGANLLTNPGFESGLTGWYAYGGPTLTVSSACHSGSKSVLISNRTQTWQGIAQSLQGKVAEGKTYKISGWVRLSNKASDMISITMNWKTSDGVSHWQHVVDATATQNNWTAIKGFHTVSGLANMTGLVLYFESPAAGVDFYVDDVLVEEYSNDTWNQQANQRIEQIRKRNLTVTVTSPAGQLLAGVPVDVRQVRHQYGFGTAVSAGQMGNGAYMQFLRDHYEWVVPENATKWPSNEPQQGKLDYSGADRIVAFCRAWDINMRGHCIFWDVPDSVQDWVKALDDTQLRAAMAGRVQSVVSRYGSDFQHWDVNNEMLHGRYYADRLGDAIRPWMFQEARRWDPDCLLFVNDYSILSGGLAPDFKVQIQWLQSQGAPVGGIGLQGHMSAVVGDYIWDQLEIMDDLGLPIWVTEYDFAAADENLRADGLETFYRTLYSHPATQGILMWGFWENAHWRENCHLVNADWTVNAAGRRFEALMKEWTTQATQASDTAGQAAFRPFHGSYEITYSHPVYGTTLKTLELLPGDNALAVSLPADNQGLNYSCYEGAFTTLPDFAALTPTRSGLTGNVTMRVADKVQNFALRFTGYLRIDTAGQYHFLLPSDDGSKLILDQMLLIDNNGQHTLQTRSGSIWLEPGMHTFELQYFQAGGDAGLELFCTGPDLSGAPIPAERFYTTPAGNPDLNGDGQVNLDDFGLLTRHWLRSPAGAAQGDLNRDSVIDGKDAQILLNFWLHPNP